jgi:hypothetical protein
MKTFKLDGVEYRFPQSFEECDALQVGNILSYQMAASAASTSLSKRNSASTSLTSTSLSNRASALIELKIGLFCLISGVDVKIVGLLTALQLGRLLRLQHWCYDAKVVGRPFASTSLSDRVSASVSDSIDLVLPKVGFGDTSAIEFSVSNVFYLAFCRPENPNADALFNLVATLCRPVRKDLEAFRNSRDWNGDEREPYNDAVATERAKFLKANMHRGIAIAILQYFEGMNNEFWKRYDVLTGASDDVPLYQNGEGQITMLMEIAETGVFGKFEDVCQQRVHTVYMFLRDKKLKADKAEIEQKLNDNYSDD